MVSDGAPTDEHMVDEEAHPPNASSGDEGQSDANSSSSESNNNDSHSSGSGASDDESTPKKIPEVAARHKESPITLEVPQSVMHRFFKKEATVR